MDKKQAKEYSKEVIYCYELYAFLKNKADTIGLNLKEVDFYNHTEKALIDMDYYIGNALEGLTYEYAPHIGYVKSFKEWYDELRGVNKYAGEPIYSNIPYPISGEIE